MKRIIIAVILALCTYHTTSAQNKIKIDDINFNWDFESGSLDSIKISNKDSILSGVYGFDLYSKFDPINPVDTLLKPSARWYFFRMTGIKGKTIKLNIKNSDAKRPFYSYDGIDFYRYSMESTPDGRSITKSYDRDTVYISYFAPYTLTRLNRKISEWSNNDWVDTLSIGKSFKGRDMTMLIVTKHASIEKQRLLGKHQDKKSDNLKRIYIHGRIHTSEAPGSWHLEKMIDIITDTSSYSKSLRDNAVFYILPFANPDGVVEGLSRSNAQGINLEINYDQPDSLTTPEVKNIKNILCKITKDSKPLNLALNMHSQSSDFVTYWIHTAKSTSDSYYRRLMLLANLTIYKNSNFTKRNLSFSQIAPRYIEGWFWNNFKGKTLAVTFETPYTFYNKNPFNEWVTIENIQDQAINNINAINDFLGIDSKNRIIVNEVRSSKNMNIKKDNDHLYFGNSYLESKSKGAYAEFTLDSLKIGQYDIYSWKVGNNKSIGDEASNKWEYIGTHIQSHEGGFVYFYEADKGGEKIDNLLLIRRNDE